MRSVYNEEMDIVWLKYQKKIERMGYLKFLEMSDNEIQRILKLDFKELLESVKTRGAIWGKDRKEIKYSVLKLRRLIALWKTKGVMCGDFNVTYKPNDKYMSFPLFDKQNYEVMPSENTIHKIKIKLIDKFIDDYNNYVDNNGHRKLKPITNLRELRMFLMADCGCEPAIATSLTNMYKIGSAKKEVWDFSDKLDKI